MNPSNTADESLRDRILGATVASCSCLTKTPVPEEHDIYCRYRVLVECDRALFPHKAPDTNTAPETDGEKPQNAILESCPRCGGSGLESLDIGAERFSQRLRSVALLIALGACIAAIFFSPMTVEDKRQAWEIVGLGCVVLAQSEYQFRKLTRKWESYTSKPAPVNKN